MSDYALIIAASVQAVATVVLVKVTISYAAATRLIAHSTGIQAEAASALAREAAAARFGGVRPVIEIERLPFSSGELISQALRDELPTSLPYRLRNIGVGPALNLWYDVDAGGVTSRVERGAVQAGQDLPELGRLPITFLTTDPPVGLAVVQYQDVYGNVYQSRLEISFNPDEDGGWTASSTLRTAKMDGPAQS